MIELCIWEFYMNAMYLNLLSGRLIRQNGLRLIHLNTATHQITKINTGIDDVFKGFNRDGIKHRDMQPWLVFSFETEVTYDETINC